VHLEAPDFVEGGKVAGFLSGYGIEPHVEKDVDELASGAVERLPMNRVEEHVLHAPRRGCGKRDFPRLDEVGVRTARHSRDSLFRCWGGVSGETLP
jgi:hypothetical protein